MTDKPVEGDHPDYRPEKKNHHRATLTAQKMMRLTRLSRVINIRTKLIGPPVCLQVGPAFLICRKCSIPLRIWLC
ncbi:hypothetical protein NB704_004188 [Pantoea ananatis]|nr:hypothetical protein [Pantoea ananatis]